MLKTCANCARAIVPRPIFDAADPEQRAEWRKNKVVRLEADSRCHTCYKHKREMGTDAPTRPMPESAMPESVRQITPDDEDWTTLGKCQRYPLDMFYPQPGDAQTARDAKKVCAACPVRVRCLDEALQNGEEDGIWGGTSPRQRSAMLRKAAS